MIHVLFEQQAQRTPDAMAVASAYLIEDANC
jgi:hypothetical protein